MQMSVLKYTLQSRNDPCLPRIRLKYLLVKQNETGKHSGKFLCAGEEPVSPELAQMLKQQERRERGTPKMFFYYLQRLNW